MSLKCITNCVVPEHILISPDLEIQGAWGSKAKVPFIGSMDIFWNHTSEDNTIVKPPARDQPKGKDLEVAYRK